MRGSSSMITRHAKRLRPDRLDAYAPCDATAAAPCQNTAPRAPKAVSTITQQTAKNLFLWSGRSFVRKALELPLALWIDFVLPKRRVLEIYLNIAEWGPNGQFGAEAGSRYAFNKSVRSLNPREAALLAARLPNPRRRTAKQPGPAVRPLPLIFEGPRGGPARAR